MLAVNGMVKIQLFFEYMVTFKKDDVQTRTLRLDYMPLQNNDQIESCVKNVLDQLEDDILRMKKSGGSKITMHTSRCYFVKYQSSMGNFQELPDQLKNKHAVLNI